MSYETYKWVHIFCALCLFLAIGALLLWNKDKGEKLKKGLMALHGLSAFFLFVSGFGLIARLRLHSFPIWVNIKLFIWLVLALVLPLLLFKKPRYVFRQFCVSPKWDKAGIWFIVILCALSAVLLAVLKPFMG